MSGKTVFCVLLAMGICTHAMADAPGLVSYQGVLTSAGNQPVDGPVEMTFRLYNIENGGDHLWEEEHPEVIVTNGFFEVVLGSENALDAALAQNDRLWLGIAITGDEEMKPRHRIGSVPFALSSKSASLCLNAADADRLDGKHVSQIEEAASEEAGAMIQAHSADPSAHHSRYTDTECITAVRDAGVPWTSITGVPEGFADGIDDDSGRALSETEVEDYVTNGPLDLAPGTTIGGKAVSTGAPYTDSRAVQAVEEAGMFLRKDVADRMVVQGDASLTIHSDSDDASQGAPMLVLKKGSLSPAEVFSVDNDGNVSAAKFIGDGSSLYGVTNSDAVDGFHASPQPAAGALLPLDQNGKIPTAALYLGSGSGFDADTLDGKHSSEFVAALHTHEGGDITTPVQTAEVAESLDCSGCVGISQLGQGYADGSAFDGRFLGTGGGSIEGDLDVKGRLSAATLGVSGDIEVEAGHGIKIDGGATQGQFLRGDGTRFSGSFISPDDMPASIDAAKIGGGAVSNSQFQHLAGVSSPIQEQLDGKQAADEDLDDLADGSLSGSKVGSGIDAGNVTAGILSVAVGGTGADLSGSGGGANQFIKQTAAGGPLSAGAIADDDVPDTITLGSITQISDRDITKTTGVLPADRGGTGLASPGAAGSLLKSDGSGWVSWMPNYLADESDGVVGNEVADAANATLSRSGTGAAGDPYKLGVNLGNGNTWTASQSFSGGANFPGSGIWNASGSVGIGTASPQAALDVNGGVRVRGGGALPSAAANLRGTIFLLQGAAGATDKIYVCAKTSSDAYQWILIGRGD